MINFTFIIPHKNLPANYLVRLIDSIPKRDDLEIIVIDDNSDPNIVDSQYFEKCLDDSVTVILDTTGLGPGHARNRGIKAAHGKWLLFADADDYFDSDKLSDFLNYLESCDADIVYMGANIIEQSLEIRNFCFGFPESSNLIEISDRRMFFPTHHQSWRRALRTEFVKCNDLYYPQMRYCEDQSVTVKAILSARKIMLFTSTVYNYIHRSSSITHTISFVDAKVAFFDSLSINRLLKKSSYAERLKVMVTILSVIYRRNRFLYYWCVLQEWIRVDFNTMRDDYLLSCKILGINSNPIEAETDILRVKCGKFTRRFFRMLGKKNISKSQCLL